MIEKTNVILTDEGSEEKILTTCGSITYMDQLDVNGNTPSNKQTLKSGYIINNNTYGDKTVIFLDVEIPNTIIESYVPSVTLTLHQKTTTVGLGYNYMLCECDGTHTINGIGSVVDYLDGSSSSIALAYQNDIYAMYNVNISKLFSGSNQKKYLAIVPTLLFRPSNIYKEIYSIYNSDESLRPVVTVKYLPNDRCVKNQVYTSDSIESLIDYNVNVRSGKLRANFNLNRHTLNDSQIGNKLPLSLSLVYLIDNRNSNTFNLGTINTYLPKGFKFNCQRYLYKDGVKDKYYFIDSSGDIHQFLKAQYASSIEKDVYIDTYITNDGVASGLILTISETEYVSTKQIKDLEGNTYIFNDYGCITSFVKKDSIISKTMYFTYDLVDQTKLISITDGLGRITNITYNENNITIAHPDNTNTVLNISNDRLVSINYPNSVTVSIDYNDGRIIRCYNTNKDIVEFEYNNRLIIDKIKRRQGTIYSYKEISLLTFEYNYLSTVLTNFKGIKEKYDFTSNGDFIESYYVDNSLSNINKLGSRFISKEDYEHYSEVSNHEYKYIAKFNTDNSESVTLSLAEASTKTIDSNILVLENTTNEVLKTGNNYTFIGQAKITNASSTKDESQRKTKLQLLNNDEIICELNFDPYISSKQIKLGMFKFSGETVNLKVRAIYGHNFGTCEFSNIGIKESSGRNIDCVNINTSEESFTFTLNNETWYKLNDPLKITHSSLEITDCFLTKDDIIANTRNINNSQNNKIDLYYNGLTKLLCGASIDSLYVYYGNTSIKIKDLKYAQVYEGREYQKLNKIYINEGILINKDITIYENNEQTVTRVITKEYNEYLKLEEEIENIETENTYKKYTYDNYGNVIREVAGNNTDTNEFIREYVYSAEGNYLTSIKDYSSNGEVLTNYTVNVNNGNITKLTNPNNQEINYTYTKTLLQSVTSEINDITNSNSINYYDNTSIISKYSHNDYNMNFVYDSYNMLQRITINTIATSSNTLYEYENTITEDLDTNKITYNNSNDSSNRDIVTYTYNKYGKQIKKDVTSSNETKTTVKYIYSDSNTLATEVDDESLELSPNSLLRKTIEKQYLEEDEHDVVTTYSYDEVNRLIQDKQENSALDYTYDYQYDSLSRVIRKEENNIGHETVNLNKYNDNNTLDETYRVFYPLSQYNYVMHTNYLYDNFKRKILSETYLGVLSNDNPLTYINSTRIKKTLEYIVNDNIGYLTNNIQRELININNVNVNDYRYLYDNMNNITAIADGETNEPFVNYTYDINNRLTREDNKLFNQTIVYSYDKGGNITSIKKYQYGLVYDNKLLYSKTFSYSNTNKDIITKVDNQDIITDNLGNITSYNGNTYTYKEGTKLSTFKKPNDTNGFRYTYDKNGLLVYAIKEEPNKLPVTYEYAYSDGKIKQIRINKNIDNISYQFLLDYLYDEDGVKGFSYRYGIKDSTEETYKMYLYKKNILGDIIGIYEYNNDGNNNCTLIEVASYKYDAYGNHKVYNSEGIEETSKLHIGNINPLRYRGYLFDVENDLYYLKSRYYSPELCRFISPDSIEYLDPETINGLNLYAYNLTMSLMEYYDLLESLSEYKYIKNIVVKKSYVRSKNSYDKLNNDSSNKMSINNVLKNKILKKYKKIRMKIIDKFYNLFENLNGEIIEELEPGEYNDLGYSFTSIFDVKLPIKPYPLQPYGAGGYANPSGNYTGFGTGGANLSFSSGDDLVGALLSLKLW